MIEDENDLSKYDYSKSAWTDKGVSAAGNVFAIKLKINSVQEKTLLERVNSALPNTVSIIACKEVPLDFNARHRTIKRVYHYGFFPYGIDLGLMREAC